MSILDILNEDGYLFNHFIHEADDDTTEDENADDITEEDAEGGNDNAGGDNANDQPEENGEGDNEDEDDVTMDDAEGSSEDQEGDDDNQGDDDESSDDITEEDSEGDGYSGDEDGSGEEELDENDPKYKLKALEKSIFDQLSPEQQESKIKELKNLFVDTYKKSQDIMNMITSAEKDPRHAKVYEYVINTLTDLQKFIRDYLSNMFESKTYIENMTELQKYLTILDTINNLFVDIKNDIDKGSD